MPFINNKIQRILDENVYEAINTLKKHFEVFNEIVVHSKTLENEIPKEIENYKNYLLNKQLENIKIKSLTNYQQGININALNLHGIKNILELSKYSSNQLFSIKGIGPVNVNRIMYAKEKILSETRDDLKIRINPDFRSENATELLKLIYEKKVNQRKLNFIQSIHKKFHSDWLTNLNRAKKVKNKLFWFFRNENNQKRINDSVIRIKNICKSDEFSFVEQEMNKYFSSIEIEKSLLWDDFIKNSPSYFSLIEKYDPKTETTTEYIEDRTPEGNVLLNEMVSRLNEVPKNLLSNKGVYLTKDKIVEIEKTAVDLTSFKSTLRAYQLFGVKFAIKSEKILLGDEMGLGKTVEAIALLSHLNKNSHKWFLVIVPSSVLINWEREVEKHSDLKSFLLHGKNFNDNLGKWQRRGGIGITTYGHLKKFELIDPKYSTVIVDEAHFIKNENTKRTLMTSKLINKAKYVLLMTGTPIENNLFEMNRLISFLNPSLSEDLEMDVQYLKPEVYRYKVANHYLRRNRKEVLKELPELTINEEWLTFSPKELSIYKDAVSNGNFMLMRQVGFMGQSKEQSSKIARLMELCEEAKSNNKKVVIFSYFLDVLETVRSCLGEEALGPINGSVSSKKRMEIIDEFANSENKYFLLCQVIAGGIGLNIQTASVVIITEPQIKPSIEVQAIARSYRMGQLRDVIVYRLLTQDSVDETLYNLLDYKQKVFDAYAKESYLADNSIEAKNISEVDIETKILKKEMNRFKDN